MNFLQHKLKQRRQQDAYRQLRLPQPGCADFCSNDYLGIAQQQLIQLPQHYASGSSGSRLLAGNYPLIQQVEEQIAQFHQAEAALLFNSGYDANLGLLSALLQRGDTVLYDQLCHASIRDGIRLGFAQSYAFEHNNLQHLQQRLQQLAPGGNVFIVTESVFSMDGDTAPLPQLVALAATYNAHLIVDEAHAIGVLGHQGQGLAQHLQLHQNLFARIYTYGKACGCHGAAIAGSQLLKDYLVNFARSLIYSTAMPPHAAAAIGQSYQLFPGMQVQRQHLQRLVQAFQQYPLHYNRLASQTAIQGVVVPGNAQVKSLADHLQQQGFDVRPILYPTVPAGTERLRIVLHAYNTLQEVQALCQCINSWKPNA
jgi:8-amino-7-oxononanoate synthase